MESSNFGSKNVLIKSKWKHTTFILSNPNKVVAFQHSHKVSQIQTELKIVLEDNSKGLVYLIHSMNKAIFWL